MSPRSKMSRIDDSFRPPKKPLPAAGREFGAPQMAQISWCFRFSLEGNLPAAGTFFLQKKKSSSHLVRKGLKLSSGGDGRPPKSENLSSGAPEEKFLKKIIFRRTFGDSLFHLAGNFQVS